MIAWIGDRSPGLPGPSAGAGIDVTLVSAATLGLASPQAAPADANVTITSPPTPPSIPDVKDASLGAADADDAPPNEAPRTPSVSNPNSVTKASTETSDTASTLDGAKHGVSANAGGDPSAADELLAQIARCLPPGERPRLLAQRLVLVIGSQGVLTAAPRVDSELPLVTAESRAAADRVVQAALQCGPYPQATEGRVVAIPVDFTRIGARG
jgi:hypothetical protein